jgi:ParB family transcriptional regulator, chromosome partitioning protein
MSVKKGLGRGFDSLVPQGTSVDIVVTPKTEKIHQLAIDVVRPKTDQPRQHFDEQLLAQLAQSIKEQGILQPIVVAEVEHNIYSIIAGERRWRGAQMAGLERIPAIIKQVDELQHLELALLENIQRSDLNAIETAKTIHRLHTEFRQSYEDIAIRLGKAYTTVVNAVRLLQLPEDMQQALMRGEISEGHGRAILSLAKHPHAQELLFTAIITKKLSVRQAEALASGVKAQAEQEKLAKNTTKQPQPASDLSQTISTHLGVNVTVPKSDKKGKITLSYASKDEFDRIIRYLQR